MSHHDSPATADRYYGKGGPIVALRIEGSLQTRLCRETGVEHDSVARSFHRFLPGSECYQLRPNCSARCWRGGFGNTVGGLGNAGGFATGGGLANGTANSNNFGQNLRSFYGNNGFAGGANLSLPSVGNYGGGQMAVGNGAGNFGGGMNMGFGTGFVPGIAPPGFTRDMFGYDVGLSSDGSGYTDFGNAMTASALGLGFGGPGFGGAGFGNMGYGVGPMGFNGVGPMAYGPLSYGYSGGAVVPGVGYVTPADMAAIAASGGVQAPATPRAGTAVANVAPGSGDDQNAQANTLPNNNANTNRPRGVRRSFLNDTTPIATANAIRIQNRLHHIKSPNFKNVKVLMSNRTALLSGSVDSKADEDMAVRMVGLEPGVVGVKSELTVAAQADDKGSESR